MLAKLAASITFGKTAQTRGASLALVAAARLIREWRDGDYVNVTAFCIRKAMQKVRSAAVQALDGLLSARQFSAPQFWGPQLWGVACTTGSGGRHQG